MNPPAVTHAAPPSAPVRRWPLPVLLGAVVLPLYALDQFTKWLVLRHISPDAPMAVIPGWFDLVYWTNTGAAFSMLSHSNGFFLGLSAVALVVLAVLYRQGAFDGAWARAGFCLLVPGVLGNLTDRLTHGSVVDFLLFDLHVPGAHPWPAFNVADSCICVAVSCFLVGSWRDLQRAGPMKAEGER